MRKYLLALVFAAMALTVTACGGNSQGKQYAQISRHASARQAYIPTHDVEFNNYNQAQKLYDSPDTIIWCSTTWGNPSSPIITVPIAGKLTSSSTSFFNPTDIKYNGDTGITSITARSVDGMYHPNPPQYRYGFTPGGQYVDFFNMPTVCTTALTKFQRQQTALTVQVDAQGEQATKDAEAALAKGDKAGAQRILAALGSGK